MYRQPAEPVKRERMAIHRALLVFEDDDRQDIRERSPDRRDPAPKCEEAGRQTASDVQLEAIPCK